jgi:tRNA (guanine37-N1)-methyltransferase
MRLKDTLSGIIPPDRLSLLKSRYTVVGDIAILSIPPALSAYRGAIADAVISSDRHIAAVLDRTSKTDGDRRVARYDLIAGSATVTLHREFGFVYRLDLTEVFFNPRLAAERMRVAAEVRAGERVFVPFGGVGPFSIPAAARGADVVVVEKNPAACRWLAENVRRNGVEDRTAVVLGDAFAPPFAPGLLFDRAIVPTPYGIDRILDAVTPLVRTGGIVHFYTFKKPHQIEGLKRAYADSGYRVIRYRRCGNVAPAVSRWVFDLAKV